MAVTTRLRLMASARLRSSNCCPVACQEVVPIDSGPWGHAAHPRCPLSLCRDDPCNRGAVVFISVIYVTAITIAGIVVVVEGGIDVWGKVLMGVVHPVVNHGDIDPCAIDTLHPNSFDINSLLRPAPDCASATGNRTESPLTCELFKAAVAAAQSSINSV